MTTRKNVFNKYKFFAILLLLSFSVSILPFSVHATDDSSTSVQESTYETIVEVEDRREQNVKHFLLPDGSYEAVVYSEPIHKKAENGKWIDIDNRLHDNNKHGYITEDERIIFNKKIGKDNKEIFSLSENGYKISFSVFGDDIKNTNAKLSNHAEKYTPNKKDTVTEQYKKLKTIDNTTTINYKNIKKSNRH